MAYPDADNLTELETLKVWCQVLESSTGQDDTLSGLIKRVSNVIVFESGRDPFFSAAVTEKRNGDSSDRLLVRADPITAVSAVSINGTTIAACTTTTDHGYTFDDDMIYLRGYTFTAGIQNISLTYTAGFTTTSKEARIAEQAALVIGAAWYRRISHMDVVTESKGVAAKDIVRTFSQKDIPSEGKRLINSLKRVSLVF